MHYLNSTTAIVTHFTIVTPGIPLQNYKNKIPFSLTLQNIFFP